MAQSEMRRRLEVARGYGGFSGRADFGEAIKMSPSTQQRVERGDRQLGDGEVLLIEKVCGVPAWFLEGGWEGWRGTEGTGDVDAEGRKALAELDRQRERSEGGRSASA